MRNIWESAKRKFKLTLRNKLEEALIYTGDDEVSSKATHGEFQHKFHMQFMVGSDMKTMLSASSAAASLMLKNSSEFGHLESEILMDGMYQVGIEMKVVFDPIEEGELEDLVQEEMDQILDIPVYHPKELIDLIDDQSPE